MKFQRRQLVAAMAGLMLGLSAGAASAMGGPSGAAVGMPAQGHIGEVIVNPYKIAPLTAIVRTGGYVVKNASVRVVPKKGGREIAYKVSDRQIRTHAGIPIAAAISLPVLVQANPLTDQGGDQTVSGDQTYTQVQATNGNTLNFTNGSIKVDNSANTTVNAPAVLVSGGSTINFGSTESKLGTVSVLANPNKVEYTDKGETYQDYPYWTTYVREGVLNVYAQKYEQKNSGYGVYVIGQDSNKKDVSSTLNLFIDEFESTSAYEALHVRQGEGAVINVGAKDQWLTSFKATKTVEESGVSLLQANEGGTINIFSKYVELNAFDTHVGGGAIGTGAWGTVITFVNGGTFTGDIVAKNITNEDGKIPEDSKDITTVSKISLNGQMTYKGDATLVGASELKLSGDIDGSESTVNSSEDSAVSVEGAISLGTVTSTSSKGVTITDGSLLTLSNGESSISELNSDGDLYLSETATAKLNTVTGKATITVDSAANTAAITKVASGSAVTARATAHFNDASASASDALTSLLETVTVGDGSSLSEAVVEEGDVNNKVTATIEDGKVVSQTETKNSKLDAFNSIATLSAFQWRHEMNDLTKRMGELRDSEGTIGAWARVYGSELQYGDQNVKQKSNSIQVGSDIEVAPGFKVGAAFNYTNGSAEYNNGDADNNAYGLGIYGTWMAENGMFLDVIAKYVRLDTDFSLNGFDGSFDNNAYSLSAEFGWRFDLNDLAFVEPQVELSYGRVAGDTFTAANGVTVKQDDFDTLIGRAGVRAGFKFPENKGNIYAKFSVAHDFQGEMDAVATNGTALNTMHSDIGGTWVEYGVGGNFRLCKNAYGYVDLERTSGAEVNANYRWNIGLRTFF